MLLAIEGFDNLHPKHYYGLPGFAYNVSGEFGDRLPQIPFYSDISYLNANKKVYLQNEGISSGYALCLGSNGFVRPRVFKKSRKVFVGFSFGPLVSGISWGLGGRLTRAFGRFSHHLDIHFINTPFNYNLYPFSDTSSLDSESSISFTCRIYFLADHTISAQFITGKNVYDPLYPTIPWSGKINCDFSDGFTYFEVCVDSEDATASGGSAELRMNGKTVYKQDGIVSSAYLNYGSDSFSEASYIRAVAISFVSKNVLFGSDNSMYGSTALVDDLYIANSEGGINDNFLGPIKISSQTLSSPSSFEFERVDDGVVVDSHSFDEFASPFFGISNKKRLESSVLGSKEELLRSFDTTLTDEIVGVANSIVSIGYSKNTLSSNIHAVIPYTKLSSAFDLPRFSVCFPGFPFFSENIQDFNPDSFYHFTPKDMSSMLFGYKHEIVSAQKVSTTAYVVKNNPQGPRVYSGTPSLLVDGLFDATFRADLCDVFFKHTSDFAVAYVDVFTYGKRLDVLSYYDHCRLSGVDSGDVDVYSFKFLDVTGITSEIFRYRFIPPGHISVRGVCIRDMASSIEYREIEVYQIMR